jgi:hypothetical protein
MFEDDWLERINQWQHLVTSTNIRTCRGWQLGEVAVPSYYNHLLFNELYFLVDGGAIWSDSHSGHPNEPSTDGLFGMMSQTPSKSDTDEAHASVVSDAPRNRVSVVTLRKLRERMIAHDRLASSSSGDQKIVGQFLYLGKISSVLLQLVLCCVICLPSCA